MIRTRFISFPTILFALLFIACPCTNASTDKFKGESITLKNVNYVKLKDIIRHYNLEKKEQKNIIILKGTVANTKKIITLKWGTKSYQMNGSWYILNHAPIKLNGVALFSETDRKNIFESLIPLTNHTQKKPKISVMHGASRQRYKNRYTPRSYSHYNPYFNRKPFQGVNVSYRGHSYVTLKSIKRFYGLRQIGSSQSILLENRKLSISLKVGSKECRMNGILFILNHTFIRHKRQLLISKTDIKNIFEPVIRPTTLKKAHGFKTVVIDAGHGGKDSGSKGYYRDEKYYTLKVARLLRDMLQRKGYNVVMTRDSDVFISLANRVRIANRYPNAIFICIHFNSGSSPRAHGIETFTISPVGTPHLGRSYRPRDSRAVPGNIMDSASVALATAVHSRALIFLKKFNITDRGIKHARFNVLTGIKIPSILIEGGFLSNKIEAMKINSLTYQRTLASSLVRAIDIYRNSVTKR